MPNELNVKWARWIVKNCAEKKTVCKETKFKSDRVDQVRYVEHTFSTVTVYALQVESIFSIEAMGKSAWNYFESKLSNFSKLFQMSTRRYAYSENVQYYGQPVSMLRTIFYTWKYILDIFILTNKTNCKESR